MERLAVLDPRIPTWSTPLEERSCPFCSDEGTSVAERPDGLGVRRCERCACFFVAPAPTSSALARFYEEYSAHATWGAAAERAKTVARARPRADPRLMTLAQLIGGIERKRVLDIGFGAAEDLVKLRQLGALVRGVDLDPVSVQFAREHLGIDARLGRLSAFAGEEHDLVLLHDVIEHELEPVEALVAALDAVRIGGVLSIWTPNASVADEDPETVIFRVDLEHMTYLSAETIRQLTTRIGAEILHLETVGHPALEDLTEGAGQSRPLVRLAESMLSAPVMCNLRRRRQASGTYNMFAVLRRTG